MAVVLALLASAPSVTTGQFFRNAAVGGVAINVDGVVSQPTVDDTLALRDLLRQQIKAPLQGLDTAAPIRKISLRRLDEQLSQLVDRGAGDLPDELKYLGGLVRVEYVLANPETGDIVLAGPADGWIVDERGFVVGKTTGLPVLLLDDLVVAFRTTQQARQDGIRCSIDPTAEGVKALQSFLRRQKRFVPQLIQGVEQAMGPHRITLSGVPENSHFARVLVAADYRMKRIAMKIDPSPIGQLESFLDLVAHGNTRFTNLMPRWWLACDYQPLACSPDGLAWQLRGQGVKVMSEEDLIGADGTAQPTGKTNPLAQKWADQMTQKYDQLMRADPVFAQLRNLMDLCVIAALIEKEELCKRAGCELPLLTSDSNDLSLEAWNPPKVVNTHSSFIQRGREFIITASGGVLIDSWPAASRSQVDASLDAVRQTHAIHTADGWWWN